MSIRLKGKDLLTLKELSLREIDQILRRSSQFKRSRRRAWTLLKSRNIAMIFQKPSTRTRVSFEVAVKRLGANPLYLSWNELQLGRGETVADTARVLDKYADGIIARVFEQETLDELASNANIPVVNALSDKYHPCQILADLQTIKEKKGRLKGLTLAYVGDGNNVCNTLLLGAAKTGMNFRAASPPGYDPDLATAKTAADVALASGSSVEMTPDPEHAVKDADVVYTDTFVSMGMESDRDQRLSAFLPRYQVTRKLMSLAKRDAIFMHCLPAHRGEEVEASVVDGSQSVVWQQAGNRLYTSMGLLSLIIP